VVSTSAPIYVHRRRHLRVAPFAGEGREADKRHQLRESPLKLLVGDLVLVVAGTLARRSDMASLIRLRRNLTPEPRTLRKNSPTRFGGLRNCAALASVSWPSATRILWA
jgi:hypothetical protein